MKKILILAFLFAAPLRAEEEMPPQVENFEQEHVKMKETLQMENTFIKVILSLLGLLLLIFVAFWVVRKLASSRSKSMNLLKSIKILEKRPISPKSMLYLIEVAGRQMLISESQFEVRSISKLEWLAEETPLDEDRT